MESWPAVERHGTESYFVLGEGLLDETVGGRDRPLAASVEAAAPPFRFRRLGPRGDQLGNPALQRLANAMTDGSRRAGRIPAGYTYLGQFVDHDLTFDKTKVALGERVTPAQLVQARSPSLDLDSLYGAGPQDPVSARFYADEVHLKVGRIATIGQDEAREGYDLPRRGGTGPAARRRRALIPDPRNDENLAVAQTHLAFIHFHNRVVDSLPASVPPAQRFTQARELVVKHYQWLLRTDYLPRICARGVVHDVFANGRKAFEVGAAPTDVPTMPIEFSVAAFRLGHSMVREDYSWNRRFDFGTGTLDLLFEFSGGSGTLGGGRRLPSNWLVDWRRFYDFSEAGRGDLVVPAARFNRAMRIDTSLVFLLRFLPAFPFEEANLALRNLIRAKMLRLATGQQMAAFLRRRGVAVTTLTKAQIRNGSNGAELDRLIKTQRDALLRDTPLWFYILREAELNRGRLDGVGARLVAETFHRAMEGSEFSIVRDPAWRPTLGPDPTTFRMVDLLLFAFRSRKRRLAPLG